MREGVSDSYTSAVALRVFVCFFSRQMFTSMSSPRGFSPHDLTLVDLGGGLDDEGATFLQVRHRIRGGLASTVGDEGSGEALLVWSPGQGAYPSEMDEAMPVPRVSVRKRVRKPMRPRAGTTNSRRIQPTRGSPWSPCGLYGRPSAA